MKILTVIALLFNITLSSAQEIENNTLMTDEQFRASQSLFPKQLYEVAQALGVDVGNPKFSSERKSTSQNPYDALDIATYLVTEFIKAPQDANDELLKRLCGEINWEKENLESECSDDDLYEELQAQTGLDVMHDPSLKIGHCSSKISPRNKNFCFYNDAGDGNLIPTLIKRSEANQLMMGYLCSDEKFPTKEAKITFGQCSEFQKGSKIENGDMSCYCSFVRGEAKNGLAWRCNDKKYQTSK